MPSTEIESAGAYIGKMLPLQLGGDRFIFADRETGRRKFGGLIMAQALMAAAQTAPGLLPHELHMLFLRPHLPNAEIRYEVERLRDGRRFSTRRVRTLAGASLLNEATIGFTAGGQGLSFQAPAPPAVPPEASPPFVISRSRVSELQASGRGGFLFEQRVAEWAGPGKDGHNRVVVWAKAMETIPDDPFMRAAALAALSDLFSPALGPEPEAMPEQIATSLNHTLWLHALPPLNGWLQFVRDSTVSVGGRVLMTGEIFSEGLRCASLAQESLQPDG